MVVDARLSPEEIVNLIQQEVRTYHYTSTEEVLRDFLHFVVLCPVIIYLVHHKIIQKVGWFIVKHRSQRKSMERCFAVFCKHFARARE